MIEPARAPVDVVIVGAGIAGLIAARSLAADREVVVVDKGRGVGGRLATRRIGDAVLDHGAQFFTVRSPSFATMVADWSKQGAAAPWFDHLPANGEEPSPHVRHRGVPAMTAIAKATAVGLDVRIDTEVTAVSGSGGGWTVELGSGEALRAAAVVLTSPVPQSLALLDAGGTTLTPGDRRALERIEYDPCLAALVPLDGPSGLAPPGARRGDGEPIAWLADNQVKGVSPVPAVTVHASGAVSRDRWDDPAEAVIADLVAAAELASPPVDGAAQLMRWRYAQPTVLHDDRCLVVTGSAPLVFAGDAFGEARVEGAALSGQAAARRLLAG